MNNKRFWISLVAGIMAAVMILSLIVGILPRASAATSSELKDQIDNMKDDQKEIQEQIDSLKSQYRENQTEIREISAQKSIVEQQVGLLYQPIDLKNDEIAAYALLIADKQEELDEAEARLAELNEKNKERIRAMEEDGAISYWSVLFQANSFSDLLDRLNMIEEIAASDRRRLDEMSAVAKEIAQAKDTLIAEKAAMEVSKAALAEKQVELDATMQKAQELLAQLMAKGEEFESLMAEQEKELAEIENEIAQKKQEYDEAKYQEWLATSVPPTTKPPAYGSGGVGGSVGSSAGGQTWLVPCDYIRVSSPFGPRTHPVHGTPNTPHNGVDLAVGCTPIYATRAGIVVTSTYSSSAGNYVMIDHLDGYKSVYMHMCKAPSVRVGEYVAAGQVIGCVGSTGWSTGSHLHFGIYLEGQGYVNPMQYIG